MIEDWLSAAAAVDPDRTFLIIAGATYSFAEVDDRAARMAGGLVDFGVGVGDRVALWANNDLPTIVALFAIWRAGASCVLVNTRLTGSEVVDQLAESAAAFIVDPHGREWLVPSIHPELAGQPHRGPAHEPTSECLIVFTSGSGGQGRGVVLSWGNLDAGQAASAQHLGHTSEDVWLGVLPIFHVGGAAILIRCAARRSAVLLHDRFEPEAVAAGLDQSLPSWPPSLTWTTDTMTCGLSWWEAGPPDNLCLIVLMPADWVCSPVTG